MHIYTQREKEREEANRLGYIHLYKYICIFTDTYIYMHIYYMNVYLHTIRTQISSYKKFEINTNKHLFWDCPAWHELCRDPSTRVKRTGTKININTEKKHKCT